MIKIKGVLVNDDFPPGFHVALGVFAVQFGRVEYVIKLTVKSLSGKGFIAGLAEAETTRQFWSLCKKAKTLATNRLPEPHRSKFNELMDRAIKLAPGRNDNLHAFWNAVDKNTARRYRPYLNWKTKILEWKNRPFTTEQLRSEAEELHKLYESIQAARKAWPPPT